MEDKCKGLDEGKHQVYYRFWFEDVFKSEEWVCNCLERGQFPMVEKGGHSFPSPATFQLTKGADNGGKQQ